jgi:hypothetical protein
MSIDAHLTYEFSSDSESDDFYYSDSDEIELNLNDIQLNAKSNQFNDSLMYDLKTNAINAKSQELANNSKIVDFEIVTQFVVNNNINEKIETNCCLVDKNGISFQRLETKRLQTFNDLDQRFEKALNALKCDQKLSREDVSH